MRFCIPVTIFLDPPPVTFDDDPGSFCLRLDVLILVVSILIFPPLTYLDECTLLCYWTLDLISSFLITSSKSSSLPYNDILFVIIGNGLSIPNLLHPAINSYVFISNPFSPQTNAYRNALLTEMIPGYFT